MKNTTSNNLYVSFLLTSDKLGYCAVEIYKDGSYEISEAPASCTRGQYFVTDKTFEVIDRVFEDMHKGVRYPNIAGIKCIFESWRL